MKTISATEAKQRFGEVLDDVRDGPVTIQKNGKDAAIILTPEEFDRRIRSGRDSSGVSAKVRDAHREMMRRYDADFRKLAE